MIKNLYMNDIPKKILIVDDDKFLLEMYGIKFKEAGISVEALLEGKKALEYLREKGDVEVLILDVVMPEIDGLAILEVVKKEKLSNDPVVIMLSNQGQESDIHRAKELGADGYIIKASSVPSEVLDAVLKIYKEKKR